MKPIRDNIWQFPKIEDPNIDPKILCPDKRTPTWYPKVLGNPHLNMPQANLDRIQLEEALKHSHQNPP